MNMAKVNSQRSNLQEQNLPGCRVADYRPFAAVILATADREKVDKRTRSKWSRVLRYAMEYKPSSEPLVAFIRRKGGINKCAARFTRCLGRRGQNYLRWGASKNCLSIPIACNSGVNVNESKRERSGIICRQFCGAA
jgi:hypothetical protein